MFMFPSTEEVFIRVAKGEETQPTERVAVLERRKSLERRASQELERRASLESMGKSIGGSLGDANGKEGGDDKEGEVDYKNGWLFFRRHMYALLVKRLLYFSRDKKAWGYQFVMPAIFVLIGVILMRVGNNSIFARVLPTLTLSTAAYNPGITVNRNPLYYNAPGYAFWQNTMSGWTDPTNSWNNLNVSGQDRVMQSIPSFASLPVVPMEVPSAYNMSLELLWSRGEWKASRYGAVTFANVSTGTSNKRINYNVHANYTGVHSSIIFSNLMADAVLRSFRPGSSLTASIKPLPVTKNEVSDCDWNANRV